MRGSFAAKAALAPLAALLCLACAQPASALYDPLASGTATLKIDKRFAAYLKANGITLSTTPPAERKGRTLALPVTGGKWDPTLGKGTAETEGAILFKSARKRVPLRDVTIKAQGTPLYAKVGGGQLKVAASKKITVSRLGFGAKLSASRLTLTAKVATRLNKKLRPDQPFSSGQRIGTLRTKAVPATIAVRPDGRAYLTPTPEILAKFQSLFVSLNPISPAELAPGPVFSFPIAGEGRIAPDASSGTLKSAGALEFLQLGAGQVFWGEQWLDLTSHLDIAEVDLRPSPPYGGKQGQVGVLSFSGGSVAADPKARTVSVQGASLTLTASSAQAFNEGFAEGKAVFSAGEAFGSVSFTAQGQ